MIKKDYDVIVVGAGFFGAICANELNKAGKKVLVIEKRPHIGGNCFTSNRDEINVHEYGPHVFHTSNEEVWAWIRQYADFNDFILNVVANYEGEIYPLPFNMFTFSKMWNITRPVEAKAIIESQSMIANETPQNLEEQAIKLVGHDIYNKLIKGYTEKQWKASPTDLPPDIIKRLPVRYNYNNNYFNDIYQGVPIGGYTQIFEKLLDGIDVELNTDFLVGKDYWKKRCDYIIYTGPIDAYFNYEYGVLDYRTTEFIHSKMMEENYQGTAIMNFTSIKDPHTRVIEHKHFENTKCDWTWLTWEYPIDYTPGKTDPYYPINNLDNDLLYSKYQAKADNLTTTFFGGRLAEYKYYDMHQVIASALTKVKEFIKKMNNEI